jgi:hypothetical protein
MTDRKTLIQEMKEAGELGQIREHYNDVYYTCVRYNQVITCNPRFGGTHKDPQTFYGPGEWSCAKGWFETYNNNFKGKDITSKVIKFSGIKNTDEIIKSLARYL